MPKIHPNHPQKSAHKKSLWLNRYRRLKEWLQSLPPLLVLRAEKLIYIFFRRKSLHLRLADRYLIRLFGGVSRSTVQRTIKKFEEVGLLKRITGKPKRQPDGSFKQERRLVLLLPKAVQKEPSYLVSHFQNRGFPQGNLEDKNSTVPAKRLDFKDYLMDKSRVTRNAFAHWLRKNEAHPRSFGFLLGTIHRKIERRPDILDAVIFDGEARQLKGQQLVGFCVSEIQTRIPA